MQVYCQDLFVFVLSETCLSGQGLIRAKHHFSDSWGFFAIKSQGLAGGIIIVWRSGIAEIHVFQKCTQQVYIIVYKINGIPWLLSGVYAN